MASSQRPSPLPSLTDEKTNQTRLRNRLATTDLRLSGILDATAATGCDAIQPTTGIYGVVHAAHRAQLDPTHAQRIIGIDGDGDQELIALQVCQAYAKEVSGTKYKERPKLDAPTSRPATKPADHYCKPSQGFCSVHKAERA